MKKIFIVTVLFIVSMVTCIGADTGPVPGSENPRRTQAIDRIIVENIDFGRMNIVEIRNFVGDLPAETDFDRLCVLIEERENEHVATRVREALTFHGRTQSNPLKLPGLPAHTSALFTGMRLCVLFLCLNDCSHSVLEISQTHVVQALGKARIAHDVLGPALIYALNCYWPENMGFFDYFENMGLYEYLVYDVLSVLPCVVLGIICQEDLTPVVSILSIIWSILAINQLEFMCYLVQYSRFS